jgi:hypothetical protein
MPPTPFSPVQAATGPQDPCGPLFSTGNGAGSDKVLVLFSGSAIVMMADPSDEKLTPSNPDDLAAALAFALKFEGRKRWHDADGFMADIVAKRLVRHLELAGYVVMKRPPLGGHSQIGRGFEG